MEEHCCSRSKGNGTGALGVYRCTCIQSNIYQLSVNHVIGFQTAYMELPIAL